MIQNFSPYVEAQTVEALHYDQPRVDAGASRCWTRPASRSPTRRSREDAGDGSGGLAEAIKLLGTNGGGFFNANSAHPYENATPLAFLEMLAILIIPAALCFSFGEMVGSRAGASRCWRR